jgi:hypothetical protein
MYSRAGLDLHLLDKTSNKLAKALKNSRFNSTSAILLNTHMTGAIIIET